MRLLANFAYGTNGALVGTSDGGFGQTQFDAVTANGSVGPIYDTGTTHLSEPSCTIDCGAGAVANYCEWFAKVGAQTDTFGRGYYRFASNPGGNTDLVRCTSTSGGGGNQLIIQITSTGKVRIVSASSAAVVSTTSITTGAFVRIEWEAVAGASATQTVKLFNSAESTTPTETITVNASSGFASIDKVRLGAVSGTASATYKQAHIEFNNTGYPGPFVAAAGGGTWYVSKNGNNMNGRSWATAWNEFNQIDYAQIAPGDTVWIDGGSTRVSAPYGFTDWANYATTRPGLTAGMMYTSAWVVQSNGASGSPIRFRLSNEAGRNGTAVVYGGRPTPLPEAGSSSYDLANQGRGIGIDLRGRSYVTIDGTHRSGIMVYGIGPGAADTSLLSSDGSGVRMDSSTHDVTLSNLEIFDCGTYGKYARPSDSALVFKTDQEGISLFGGANITIDRCLIHDCGQDAIQGGPAPGFQLTNSWLYFSRQHSTWTGYGFNAGSQAVADQDTTHVDGIQLYNAGIGETGGTVDYCIAGPMVNQAFYFGDGSTASYNNMVISNSIALLPFRHGIQGDVGSGSSPSGWTISNCTIHSPMTPFTGYGSTWSPVEVEGGNGSSNHVITNTIATWGGVFFKTNPTNWNTGACSGNIYYPDEGTTAIPGGSLLNPLFVNPIGQTNNTPTFAQALALDLTPTAGGAVGKGAPIHKVQDLLDRIDSLNAASNPPPPAFAGGPRRARRHGSRNRSWG